MMDLAGFRAALGDIPVEDNPRLVQQKSRDHYWYSPRLKAELPEWNVIPRQVSRQRHPPCSHNVLQPGQNRSFGPTGPIK